MILIISNKDDQTTNEVCLWLSYMNVPFKRINGDSIVRYDNIMIDSESIDFELNWEICGKREFVRYSEIKACWYRRGQIAINLYIKRKKGGLIHKSLIHYLIRENKSIRDFILHCLSIKSDSIGNYFENFTNKNFNLMMAAKAGLLIPQTIITKKISNIQKIATHGTTFVTKGINDSSFEPTLEMTVGALTSKVFFDGKDKDGLWGLSLFQKNIQKKLDIRVFYFSEQFFSMAIFSQNDPKTTIDFRAYNYEKRNRAIPYILPTDIIEKLTKFIKATKFRSGSFDLVLSTDDKYYFLEINPIGQFRQVSIPCNYYLEKYVANHFLLALQKTNAS